LRTVRVRYLEKSSENLFEPAGDYESRTSEEQPP